MRKRDAAFDRNQHYRSNGVALKLRQSLTYFNGLVDHRESPADKKESHLTLLGTKLHLRIGQNKTC